MGMGVGELELIKQLRGAGYLRDNTSVAEIGAQQLNDSFLSATAALEEVRRLFNVDAPAPKFSRSSQSIDPNDQLSGSPPASLFWTWLGFTSTAVDIDGTPGSIPLDLNFDEVPADMIGKFDLVTNLGTTEHTANQLQAFKIIHDLTSLDGVMLHNVPMGGMFSHGLISYNPRFFWEIARANGYNVVFMTLSGNAAANPMSESITSAIAANDPSILPRFAEFRAIECAVIAVLQKQIDQPFFPPLDVPEHALAENSHLSARYWTMAGSNAFSKREAELAERSKALYQREQHVAREEEDLRSRKKAVYEREQRIAARERDQRRGLFGFFGR